MLVKCSQNSKIVKCVVNIEKKKESMENVCARSDKCNNGAQCNQLHCLAGRFIRFGGRK